MPTAVDPRLVALRPTVNEAIQNRAIRHALFVQQFGLSQAEKMVGFFNEQVVPDLLARIEARLLRIRSRGFDTGPWTTQRLRDMGVSIDRLLGAGYGKMAQGFEKELQAFATTEAEVAAAHLADSTPIQIDFRTPSPPLIRTLVTQSPIQGRFLRDWVTDLSAETYRLTDGAIKVGLAQGETVDQIVRRLAGTRAQRFTDGVLQIPRHHIKTWVRTSITHVSNVTRHATFKENRDVIKKWKFVATLDTKTTEICMSHDGRTYDVGTGDVPPLHPNCRSTTVPIMKSWQELGINLKEAPEGTRSSMFGEVPAGVTYPKWLAKQPEWVQVEALGRRRADLFRKGQVKIDRFVNSRGKKLNLEQLRTREGLPGAAIKPPDARGSVVRQGIVDDWGATEAKHKAARREMQGFQETEEGLISKTTSSNSRLLRMRQAREEGTSWLGNIGQEKIDELQGWTNQSRRELAQVREKLTEATAKFNAIEDGFKQRVHDRLKVKSGMKTSMEFTTPKNKDTFDKINNGVSGLSRGMKGMANEAREWVSSVVSSNALDDISFRVVKISKKAEQRAFAFSQQTGAGALQDSGRIFMTTKNSVKTYVHEIGHVIEGRKTEKGKKILKRIGEFLRARLKAEPKGLQAYHLYGDHAGEWTFDDKFFNEYVGKLYTGKGINSLDAELAFFDDISASEVLSMGLQEVYRDPLLFIKEDPEMFDLIIDLIRGNA
jgi:SPP1 gp7 family putative phage head morphogenesis protein